MEEEWEIIHIPEKTPSSFEESTVEVVAAAIEPKLANAMVRQLNQICPLVNLRHVKRVRKRIIEGKVELAVILCLSSEHNELTGAMPHVLLQLINNYQLTPFTARVAGFAASSKEEWEEQCKFWPTSYHPPANPDGVAGLSEEDTCAIFSYMKMAIELAKSSYFGEVVNAAVIVDPMSRQVIAGARDQTSLCPSTTNGSSSDWDQASNVASSPPDANNPTSNGGSLPKLITKECRQSYHGVSCLYPWSWSKLRPDNPMSLIKCNTRYTWHPLRHATLVAIENAAARDRDLFPSSGYSVRHSFTMNNSSDMDDIPPKRQKTNILENANKSAEEIQNHDSSPKATRPYLCTGFDIYLVWEPCTMCAMALVHQRIRRVFFAFPNPNVGALGSAHRLQGKKNLNHHYSVFRILLPEKALTEVNPPSSDNHLQPANS